MMKLTNERESRRIPTKRGSVNYWRKGRGTACQSIEAGNKFKKSHRIKWAKRARKILPEAISQLGDYNTERVSWENDNFRVI